MEVKREGESEPRRYELEVYTSRGSYTATSEIPPETVTPENLTGILSKCFPTLTDEITEVWYTRHLHFSRCQVCHHQWLEGSPTACPACLETHIICNYCNCWFNRSTERMEEDGHRDVACEACRNERVVCNGCGYWTDEPDDNGYCEDCQTDEGDLHHYAYRPTPEFLPSYLPNTLYLGVELETDRYSFNDRQLAIESLNNLDNETTFYLKEDGSLSQGIEITTHPATLEYHLNTFAWSKIVNIVREHNGISHDNSNCGLHIHFNTNFFGKRDSQENELNSFKLVYLFERFWVKLVRFSRRDYRSLESWARRYADIKPARQSDRIKKIKELKGARLKYYAVNLANRDTIEIRIFKGTLKIETLFATLELVDFLVRFVKQRPITFLRKLKWEQLVGYIQKKTQYKYLMDYLKTRELIPEEIEAVCV